MKTYGLNAKVSFEEMVADNEISNEAWETLTGETVKSNTTEDITAEDIQFSGSPKQISWAKDIIAKLFEKIDGITDHYDFESLAIRCDEMARIDIGMTVEFCNHKYDNEYDWEGFKRKLKVQFAGVTSAKTVIAYRAYLR